MTQSVTTLEARHAELLDEQHARELQAEINILETEGRLVEPDPWMLYEEWGQRISQAELNRDISWGYPLGELDDINSRQDGDHKPVYETELQLASIRGRSRSICDEVPSAIGALRNLTNYVIGTNWGYEVTPREGQQVDPRLTAAVQGAIDMFLESTRWIGGKDRETFRRVVRDGEAFVRLKMGRDGIPQVRFVEPAHVTEPRTPMELEEWLGVHEQFESSWKWGIHTTADDVNEPLGYHVVWDGRGESWDYLTPDELHHIKSPETDSNVKRGLSEFYPVRNHLPRAEKVFAMTAEGAAMQAAIAGVKEAAEGAKAADIEALNRGNRTHTRREPTQFGTRDIDVQHMDRPKVITIKGYKWANGPMGSSRNPNLILAGQAVLRLVGSPLEYAGMDDVGRCVQQ